MNKATDILPKKESFPNRYLIDALNAIGYCVKYRSGLKDLLSLKVTATEDMEVLEEPFIEETNTNLHEVGKRAGNVFLQLLQIYNAALKLDPNDVEANFNMGSLYQLRAENSNDPAA